MTRLTLRFDLRTPPFARCPDDYYRTALDMAEWADAHGFSECMVSEHHGEEDGYLPSPLVMAAAIAARTRRMRIRISALILPLHDPLRIAEDVAVLDRLSGGRIELVCVAGFRPGEFAQFDKPFAARIKLLEHGIATLKQAWSGEPFTYQGRKVRITPRPLQRPHPPLLLGGSTPQAARRAARIADGFVPAVPELYPIYHETCQALGVTPSEQRNSGPAAAVFLSADPAAAWARIAPHALHETNSYARWYAETGTVGPYQPITEAETLRESGLYQVLSVSEGLGLAQTLGDNGWLFVHPLLAGLDPEVGWETLRLFGEALLPAQRQAPG